MDIIGQMVIQDSVPVTGLFFWLSLELGEG